jgi:uncharacterized protein
MKTALLSHHDELRTFVVVFETGDEPMGGLAAFAKKESLGGSQFTAIGAFSRAIVVLRLVVEEVSADSDRRAGRGVVVRGDITIENSEPKVHAHVVLGKADGTCMAVTSSKVTFDPHSKS